MTSLLDKASAQVPLAAHSHYQQLPTYHVHSAEGAIGVGWAYSVPKRVVISREDIILSLGRHESKEQLDQHHSHANTISKQTV